MHRIVIFLTGAIVIGLELVSSRILTPYFGSSLFVWTAVLSVTLSGLAYGYHAGGKLAQTLEKASIDFAIMPVYAAFALLIAKIIIKNYLPLIAETNLVIGAFVAASIILLPALIALSSLNPLLVAIEKDRVQNGDAGSGNVFAISTVGSIFGAVVTAFAIVPHIDAPRILCVFAAGLILLSCIEAINQGNRQARNFNLAMCAVCSLLLAVSIFDTAPSKIHIGNNTANLLATYLSPAGNVSVVRFEKQGSPPVKLYMQNGGVEGATDEQNRAVAPYTYLIYDLLNLRIPGAKKVLVIGLAAGSIPMLFKQRDIDVDIVDINPDSPMIAADNFGFTPQSFNIKIEDARVALRGCDSAQQYDAIIFDAFSGIDPVEHLATIETFQDAARCLRPDGAIIINIVSLSDDSAIIKAITAAVGSVSRQFVWAYALPGSKGGIGRNIILLSGGVHPNDPTPLVENNFQVSFFDRKDISLIPRQSPVILKNILRDDRNFASLLFAKDQLALRKSSSLNFPVGW